jgi:hypothetical protein
MDRAPIMEGLLGTLDLGDSLCLRPDAVRTVVRIVPSLLQISERLGNSTQLWGHHDRPVRARHRLGHRAPGREGAAGFLHLRVVERPSEQT